MRKAITERGNADTPTADAVRAELARARKTQQDAATVLGLSITAVHRRLNGDVEFTASELHRLAGWLGVPAATLLGDITAAQASA